MQSAHEVRLKSVVNHFAWLSLKLNSDSDFINMPLSPQVDLPCS